MTISLADANALLPADFIARFGDVAEHSPWVAERAAAARPWPTREAMIAAFVAAIEAASVAERLALIRAHPDLAGKAARAGDMAADSKKEQAGAGLSALSDADFDRFTHLNAAYREKFGFPFILAVKGATKEVIFDAFEARLEYEPPSEFAEAIRQIGRIVRFRLEERVTS
ncbi:MAG: 2-oxo-4-hydroxy-4-carboxy-5-ureidoimidazoline decarboxylase [Hyphomicrobiales bacterium]|nr:2-oxo-4-hydroxy-4-carboxy-5-ureidoimidazoline decarboxylase [Hyphomicrobiales bacterium]